MKICRLPIIAFIFAIAPDTMAGECKARFKPATLFSDPISSLSQSRIVERLGPPITAETLGRGEDVTIEMSYKNIGSLRGEYTIVLDKKRDRVTHVTLTPSDKNLASIEARLSARIRRCRYKVHSCDADAPEGRIVESAVGSLEFVEIPERGLVFHLNIDGTVNLIEMISMALSSDDPPCARK